MKPQILILGSTGRTGKWLLAEALEAGFILLTYWYEIS